MNEANSKLDAPLGKLEPIKLEAKPVKVVGLRLEEKGDKKNEILIVTVKHPDQEETFEISKLNYLKNKTITTSGLWFKLDKEGGIVKYSALYTLLKSANCSNIKELIDKTIPTDYDEQKYLVLKAY